MSFVNAFVFALAFLPAISALACTNNPLPRPTTVHRLRGHFSVRHRTSLAGIPDESRGAIDTPVEALLLSNNRETIFGLMPSPTLQVESTSGGLAVVRSSCTLAVWGPSDGSGYTHDYGVRPPQSVAQPSPPFGVGGDSCCRSLSCIH